MLLPDLPTSFNIFNRNFINFWTKLLRDDPAEQVFNQDFNVFTQERRQFRPRENPDYLQKHCPAEVLNQMNTLDEYLLSVIPDRIKLAVFYPSVGIYNISLRMILYEDN